MYHWYYERPDEITLDMDTPTDRDWRRAEQAMRALDGLSMVVSRSQNAEHAHVYMRLARALPERERHAAHLWLGDDPQRVARSIMRYAMGQRYPYLLIEREKVRAWREPNASCECQGPHDHQQMQHCPMGRAIGRDSEPASLRDVFQKSLR